MSSVEVIRTHNGTLLYSTLIYSTVRWVTLRYVFKGLGCFENVSCVILTYET